MFNGDLLVAEGALELEAEGAAELAAALLAEGGAGALLRLLQRVAERVQLVVEPAGRRRGGGGECAVAIRV